MSWIHGLWWKYGGRVHSRSSPPLRGGWRNRGRRMRRVHRQGLSVHFRAGPGCRPIRRPEARRSPHQRPGQGVRQGDGQAAPLLPAAHGAPTDGGLLLCRSEDLLHPRPPANEGNRRLDPPVDRPVLLLLRAGGGSPPAAQAELRRVAVPRGALPCWDSAGG